MQIVFLKKTKEEMGDTIAINWLSQKDDSKWGIKEGQVFVREDWWDDEIKRERLRVHEMTEVWLIKEWDISYELAHEIATLTEHKVLEEKGIKWKGK